MGFEVVNTTSHMFWVKYSVDNLDKKSESKLPPETVVTLAPHSGRRLMIPFHRFDINKELIKDVTLQSELRQFVRSENNLTPEQEDEVRYHYLMKKELIRHVHVSWKSDFQTSGVLSLERLTLNSNHVTKLTPDSLDFFFHSDLPTNESNEILISGAPCVVLEPTQAQFSKLSVEIKNFSERVVNVSTKITVCEDLGSGMHNLDPEEKFIWTGALDFSVLKLQPHDTYTHEIGVCFLAPGKFRLS